MLANFLILSHNWKLNDSIDPSLKPYLIVILVLFTIGLMIDKVNKEK